MKMHLKRITILSIACYVLVIGCQSDSSNSVRNQETAEADFSIYELKSSSESGIDFNNEITETKDINTVTFDGMLQGAGVAVLDFNKDGLQDIYFAGNQVGDKLFENKGSLKFEDVTEKAGITDDGNWSTGVSVADVNGDGWDDIYVCKFLYDNITRRENKLYINQKNGRFKEEAAKYGIADKGYGIMANFFDMDNDGDLDMYLANQPPNSLDEKTKLKGKRDLIYSDRLFEFNGQRFIDVTKKAGMLGYNYSLSTTAADLNNDGLTDLFVACDYEEPDMLFYNQGSGQFSNDIDNAMKHLSNFSMGADITDINNDGLLDIYAVDMVAEDNFRQKTNMSGMNPEKFWALANNGYHFQYMFNALHLNNGNNTFSEIAQMAGISNTDWSWTPLFIDMDHDGLKDLMITNGIIKEMRNKDYEIWRTKLVEEKRREMAAKGIRKMDLDPLEIANKAPKKKLANYLYRNTGDLKFEKKQNEWGFSKEGWSQGAAYADFDNDGDLDLIINNMNETADLYVNKTVDKDLNNYIAIELEGYANNSAGINSRVEILYGDQRQILDYSPFRGYMSTSQDIAHFGLGGYNKVDIKVTFPDGSVVTKSNIDANQTISVSHSESNSKRGPSRNQQGWFAEINSEISHKENEFDDYSREILIPYKMSSLGPHLAIADINNDGNDDLFIGGSVGHAGQIWLGDGNSFQATKQESLEADHKHEDGGAQFGDIDGDGDLDLYVASGGNEYNLEASTPAYQDRIYFNDGTGTFTKVQNLPYMNQSSTSPVFLDFDEDGDQDIFVCGRQYQGKYGMPMSSLLLEQREGRFVDVTTEKGAEFLNSGMTTKAAWKDIDGDGQNELITCGEWMPIIIYEFNQGKFSKKANQSLKNTKGMWNTMDLVDIDGDGDLDIIGGNLGLNNKYTASVDKPFKVFVNDFDENGTHDVYLGYYDKEGVCYPVRGRQCSSEQMPFVKKKFESYENFALASIEEVLDGKLEGSVMNECQTFAHTVYFNDGKGNFESREFSREGQTSPVYGIVTYDFNDDGILDVFMSGNLYDREVETTRSDAGTGHVYMQTESGEFIYAPARKTGLWANKDARVAKKVNRKGKTPLIVVANNNDKMQIFEKRN